MYHPQLSRPARIRYPELFGFHLVGDRPAAWIRRIEAEYGLAIQHRSEMEVILEFDEKKRRLAAI